MATLFARFDQTLLRHENLETTEIYTRVSIGKLTEIHTTTTYDGVGNVLTVNGPLAGSSDTTRYVWDVT